jgi:hypothetical protein
MSLTTTSPEVLYTRVLDAYPFHPYDLDLNLDEIASEVRTINPSLSEAIAHDIAHSGDAEVEQSTWSTATPMRLMLHA